MNYSRPLQVLKFILFFRLQMKLILIVLGFLVAVIGILSPILQKIFIDQLTGNTLYTNSLPTWAWLLLSGLSLLLSLACYQTLVYLSTVEAVKTQHALAEKLYQKLLSLRPLDYQKRTTGEFISVYATDIPSSTILVEQSLPQGLNILFPMILAPLVLIRYFEVPGNKLIPALILFVILNLSLAYRQSLFFYKFKYLAAKRIGVVNEWIQNIRSLRVMNWIPIFEDKIYQAREIETRNRIRMLNNGQTMNAVSSSMTFALTTYILWLMLKHYDQSLSPGNLLAVFWIVSVFLTRTFRQLPWFFTFLFDAWTSIKRLSEAFSLGNEPEHNLITQTDSKEKTVLKTSGNLIVKGLNLLVQGHPILINVNFEIQAGEFVGLVGPVGSGKSLLLLSLLGETDATFEAYQFGDLDLLKLPRSEWKRFFSYIPQDGFLMSATVRDNLHLEYFASSENDPFVLDCLPKVQFDILSEGLTQGLNTEVGERGVNLSGGQKQRLSLARSLLISASIHLFDDCLSAVDVNTEKYLVEELFNKDFATHIRVLVTTRFQVLKNVNRILFLKNGNLVSFGSYSELEKKSEEFHSFIHQTQSTKDQSKELE
jgi:ABC-type multidrug transport system fused ATPase/permease subunit